MTRDRILVPAHLLLPLAIALTSLILAGCEDLEDILGEDTDAGETGGGPGDVGDGDGPSDTGGNGDGGTSAACTTNAQCTGGLVCVAGACVEPGSADGPSDESDATVVPGETEDERRCRLDCQLAQECDPERFGATYSSVSACTTQCARDIADARSGLPSQCFEAQYERLRCVGSLDSCDELDAYAEGTPGARCVAERNEALAACDPLAEACQSDCSRFATCEPGDFAGRYPSEDACFIECLDGIDENATILTPQCFDAQSGLFLCTAALDCAGFAAYEAGSGNYPCRESEPLVVDACDEQLLCEIECVQIEECSPEYFADEYGSSFELCVDTCANDVEQSRLNRSRPCYEAQMDRFACVSGLSCADLDRFFDDTIENYPCRSEVEAAAGVCE